MRWFWFPAVVWFLAFLVYFETQAYLSPARLLSKTFAASGTVLLAISIGITGLALFWDRTKLLLLHRKSWGLAGFVFALTHATIAFYDPLSLSINVSLSRPNVRLGLMALAIFAVLAGTSTAWAQRKLGRHWKTLQRAGYVGLFLVWADILVLADGSFVKTPVGLVLFSIVTLGLALGLLGWFKKEKIEKNEN